MNRFTVFLLVFVTSILSWTLAKAADPFDLGSIGLHPSYLSAAAMRENASLHSVAMAPASTNRLGRSDPNRPESSIGIAVGDAGTILRTQDAGQSWRLIDRITPLAEFEEPAPSRFGSRRPRRPVIGMPSWHFYDVKWLSPSDAVVIGGGFEPVTGISRGVCLFSSDAGATWSMGNAHELPRLMHFAPDVDSRRPGMIEVHGDRAEASGVDRFFSQDGGRTWIEDTTTSDSSSTESYALDQATNQTAASIQVSEYGRIQLNQDGTWQTVRGQGRHAAVAFVCGSADTTPWSLIGRESLHENNRVVVALTDPNTNAMKSQRWADAAKIFGAAVGNLSGSFVTQPSSQSYEEWLRQHRPTVLALDTSLPEEIRRKWMRAIESVRLNGYDNRASLQRVVLVRSTPAVQGNRDASVFRRSSILRSDALLTGPAVLAGDFASDAFMIAAPGSPTPAAIEVTTLDDLSGAIRRDISMTSGIALSEGQTLGERERHVAANRRLQIATARVAQSTNLRNQLAAMITRTPDTQLRTSVEQTLRNAIAMTAPADQTRMLWDRLVDLMNQVNTNETLSQPGISMVRSMILQQLAQTAAPASIRRWAELIDQATGSSIERAMMSQTNVGASKKWATRGLNSGIRQASHEQPIDQREAGNVESMSRGGGGMVSPFQVAPASYTAPATGFGAPTAIMIAESKPTTWQTPRGMALNRAPAPAEPSQDNDIAQRTNWDYHPVVMAARRIGQSESSPATTTFNPPTVASRPYLDGHLNDPCWQNAASSQSVKVLQDQDFYFVGIVANERSADDTLRVRLDCDGDYLTSIQLDWHDAGTKRATVDGLRLVPVTWYGSSQSATEPTAISPSNRSIELAIAKQDLPGPLHFIRIDRASDDLATPWEAMPNAAKWLPNR